MLPKQRQSIGRSKRRRSHDAITGKIPTICPLSGMPKLSHHACPESGYVRPVFASRFVSSVLALTAKPKHIHLFQTRELDLVDSHCN